MPVETRYVSEIHKKYITSQIWIKQMSVHEEIGRENYPKSYQRRSRLEIYLDILRAVKNGVNKPTRIMYAVNISWNPLQKILEPMVSGEFLRKIESKGDKRTTRHYEITQSGLNILNYLDKEKDFLRLIESTHSA